MGGIPECNFKSTFPQIEKNIFASKYTEKIVLFVRLPRMESNSLGAFWYILKKSARCKERLRILKNVRN